MKTKKTLQKQTILRDPALEHKEKRLKVLGPEGDHEYDLVISGYGNSTYYTLSASRNALWADHIKGTKILTLTDDGDKTFFDKDLKAIDYDVLLEMRILINFRQYMENRVNPISDTYTVVQEAILLET